MIQRWKASPILKGLLTWFPLMNAWRTRHASTAGSDSARYCYAVWLRHLVTLDLYGFKIDGARIGELGPGDSIGSGLAACNTASVSSGFTVGGDHPSEDVLTHDCPHEVETVAVNLYRLRKSLRSRTRGADVP